MSDLLPFGARVRIAHVIRPVYLKWKTHEEVRQATSPDIFWAPVEKVKLAEPRLVRAAPNFGEDEDDIGADLPEPSETPIGGAHRRLRRWPLDAEGVVVGRTFRIEGRYHEGYRSSYMGYEHEPAFLSESRRLWVYQVALCPGDPGRTACPVAVVDAIPEDITEVPA